MKAFKKKPVGSLLTRKESLEFTPVKNLQIKEVRLKTGDVQIEYPLAMRPWIAALARRLGAPQDRVRTRKLQLDALGTAVWDLMDGERSVRQIIKAFASTHQLQTKEAEVSVTRFIRELGKRGLIGLN
ncbi:MAG: PqqD family protein [Desulfobacterales bacterium]|jgi:hypothetical protein